MKKNYYNVTIAVPNEHLDILMAYLWQLPIIGIEEKNNEIIICFDEKEWNDDISLELNRIIKEVSPEINITSNELIQEKNWNEEWERDIEPVIINDKIGISTEGKLHTLKQEIKIAINPKMSFGTGHHESTRLACRLVERAVVKDSFWIDAGTGTGVLAILAAMLGAKNVFAFDNNEWSIENAFENIYLNKVNDAVEIKELDLSDFTLPESDGIVANLNFELALQYMEQFYSSLKNKNGLLILSGILIVNKDEVLEKAYKYHFELIDSIIENEWIGLLLKITA